MNIIHINFGFSFGTILGIHPYTLYPTRFIYMQKGCYRSNTPNNNYATYVNENRELNKNGDDREVHLICVRQNGDFIIPRSMQHTSSVIHHELGFPEFDMHSLIVTHATMLIENGAPVKYVQQRLGHKKLEVTMQIYTKLSPLMIEQGKNVLDSIF